MLLRTLGAIAFVVLLAGCGTNTSTTNPTPTPTPTPANQTPSITSLTVSPTFGVSGLTQIMMSASATDADGDALTYAWSFAGMTASGATTTATLTGDGTIPVQVTVSDGRGATATQSTNVTLGNFTGNWSLVAGPCGSQPGDQPAVMTLTQSGTSVTGTLFWPGPWCNQTPRSGGFLHDPATIDAQGNFSAPRISGNSGIVGNFSDFALKGKMDTTGRTVTGMASQSGLDGFVFTMTKM